MLQNKKFFDRFNLNAISRASLALGACSALMAFFSLFLPIKITIFFISLPLFLSYLSFGSVSGLVSSLISTFFALLIFPIGTFCEVFLNIIAPAMLLGFFSIQYIQKERKKWWYPESFLLRDFVFLSLVSVIFLSLTFCSEKFIDGAYKEAFRVLFKPDDPNAILLQRHLKIFVRYSVGTGAFVKMLATVLNFRLAHVMSKRLKKNIRPSFDFLNISIPYWMALLPLISLTIAMSVPYLSFLFSGLFIVSLFAPIVNGLSIVHYYAKTKKKNGSLIAAYTAIFIIPIFAIFTIIFLGIADSFCDLRSRIKKV